MDVVNFSLTFVHSCHTDLNIYQINNSLHELGLFLLPIVPSNEIS